jgi:Zn-dependent metalloprotease
VSYSNVPSEFALDALGISREFACLEDSSRLDGTNSSRLLRCRDLEVCTHDYRMTGRFSPRELVRNPPHPWDKVGISAHANTLEVARFLRDELEHHGVNGEGLEYASFVHYFGKYADNAFWFPGHNIFVYGQHERINDGSTENIYYAAGMSIVAHEIFHGVTHFTAGLESENQPGALNESYSDIFGILLGNRQQVNIEDWTWEIGIPQVAGRVGFPIRDLCNPSKFGQPDHMRDYVTTQEDQGGIHINNGIHNKAAYNLLTSRDSQGKYLFNVSSAGLLFYLALRRLRPHSDFAESRLALTFEVSNCFQDDSEYRTVIAAVNSAFDSVGIQ